LGPDDILNCDTTHVPPGDVKAVDPSAQTTLDGCMTDVVIHRHSVRIEVLQQQVQVPDGSAHYSDAGVSVIHGARVVLFVQCGQLRNTRLHRIELLKDRALGIVTKSAPAI